jgi:dimethylargininase
MQRTAIVRGVPRSIDRCELTHVDRGPIDLEIAEAEHAQYVLALAELGCRIVHLPAIDDLPDSVFVEDAAVVVDELAILTRPGADSRRREVETIAPTLSEYRPLVRMVAPATLDGGDVLRVGKDIYVGLSQRTNQQGVDQLRALLEPFGYVVRCLDVTGCLHLKTAVTCVRSGAQPLLLINPSWIDPEAFGGLETLEVDPSEPTAANARAIGDTVLFPERFEKTRRRLTAAGLTLRTVPAGELAKAEGGLTCCSVLV